MGTLPMMVTADQLLAHVYAEPSDDRPRRVYADFLLERGDPQGELIALQLDRGTTEGTPAGRRREKALLDAGFSRWVGPLAPALQRPDSRFERGFLAQAAFPLVSTSQRALDRLVGVPTWITVHTVRAAHATAAYLPVVLHPVLRHLRRVALDADDLPACVKAPWALDALELRAFTPSARDLDALAALPAFAALRELRLETETLASSAKLPRAVLARLEHLAVSVRAPPPVGAALRWLTDPQAQPARSVGTFALTATYRAGQLTVALHQETEAGHAFVRELLAKASPRTKGLCLRWAPGRQARPTLLTQQLLERTRQEATVPLECAGFPAVSRRPA